MRIILIGFMGSGKSSVAKRLGSLSNTSILEMDEFVIQKTQARDMHEVFAKGGELLLRETEIAIAREYAAADYHIISTGAGVVMNKIILDYFKRYDRKIFFLNASFPIIAERMKYDTNRPLFNSLADAEALYDFRTPLYLQYADHVVDVDEKTVEEIAQEIERNYGLCKRQTPNMERM